MECSHEIPEELWWTGWSFLYFVGVCVPVLLWVFQ